MEIAKFQFVPFCCFGTSDSTPSAGTEHVHGNTKRTLSREPEDYRKHVRARENDLRELLASSVDAVVVSNLDRRFVAANPNALNLFGVLGSQHDPIHH